MSYQEVLHQTVEKFLEVQRNSVSEDRKTVTALLEKLLQEQQISGADNKSHRKETRSCSSNETQKDNIRENRTAFDEKTTVVNEYCEPQLSDRSRKLKEFNSQIEKEKLVEVFENAPYALSWPCRKKKESSSSRRRKNSKQNFLSEDKENQLFNLTPDADIRKNATVRCGEFSPLNPAFRSEKKVLNLGDYEELRKKFLEKKKQEYVQYFQDYNVKRKTESGHCKNVSRLLEINSSSNQSGKLPSENTITSPNVFFTFYEDRKIMPDSKQCQQAAYRHELDKQIEEKRKLRQAEKENEKRNCEICSHQDMERRQNLMKDIERKFCERIRSKNSNNREPAVEVQATKEIDIQHLSGQNQCHKSKKSQQENNFQVTSCRRSPILKPTTEACAVDNYEEYQRMQRELYKRDLAQQIDEKKKLERERKRKEMEMERRIEENVRKEEEKLRLQYEKEQAERNYPATQKAQTDKHVQDNLCNIKKQNEDRRKFKKITALETCIVYPTNHQINDKPKNVTFAPHALLHRIPVDHSLGEGSRCPVSLDEENRCSTGATIVQAPYVLAIKDGLNNNVCAAKSTERPRSPSPILPALKTRNLINALPKTDCHEIPAGVSMSKQTRSQFLKDERILLNLSEIRRKLRENQCKSNCNNG